MKKKKQYEQPETAVTRVELESPICSGSVQFDTTHEKVKINSQDFADMNGSNDFSANPWEVSDQN
jgi:hypothetical protein